MSRLDAIGLSLAASVSLAAFTSPAIAADARPATGAPTPEPLTLSEADDQWLHERCAYRGLSAGVRHDAPPGAVLELVGGSDSKEFRCAERPPFWKTSWTPASAADVACAGANGTCTTPLSPEPAPKGRAALLGRDLTRTGSAARAGESLRGGLMRRTVPLADRAGGADFGSRAALGVGATQLAGARLRSIGRRLRWARR